MPPWAMTSTGAAPVDAAHVVRVAQALADLQHRRVGAAVRAAGAVGGRPRRHGQRAARPGRGRAPRPRGPGSAAAAGTRRAPRAPGGASAARAMSGSMPDASGNPRRPAGEALAPHGLAAALQRAAHLVLQVAGALLHHHDLVDAVRQPPHRGRVDRPGEPEAQQRDLPVQAERDERAAQERVGGAGHDDPEAVCPDRVRAPAGRRRPPRPPPSPAAAAARGCRPRATSRTVAGRRRGPRGSPPCRGRPAARADGRRAVGGEVHHAGAVGLHGRHDHADDQPALARTGRRRAARSP